jgi:hypothetical protein
MKSKTLLFALLLLGTDILRAQDNGAEVSMRIDFVSWGEDLSGLEVRNGKRGDSVKALAFRYSKPLEYSGSQILALALGEGSDDAAREMAEAYEERRRSDKAEGLDVPDAPFVPQAAPEARDGEIPKTLAQAREKDPALAALVKLPAASRRVTILLAPGPDRSLVPHIFDDDPTRQPLGMVRVHNLSKHTVSLLMATGKARELQPGKSFLVPAPEGTFAYELAYQTEGAWKLQENNLVNVRANEQMHMVILRSEASFFSSSDGSRGGFMQTAFLRRTPQ